MKHLENIDFRDSSMPIKIIQNRSSFVYKINNSANAFHEALEIKYFVEGESTLLIGTKTVNAQRGDVIVINPYEFHATVNYGNENHGKYHLFMIGLDIFDGARCPEVNARHCLLEKGILLKTKISQNERITSLLEKMVCEYENGKSYSNIALYGLTAQLFCELLRESSEGITAHKSNESLKYYTVIEPALRMIRDDFSEKFTVDSLADACSVSKYHFCRIFKSVMGMGAIRYLNLHRLKIADALLKSTSLSVSEIADYCGFEELNYFSRLYKSVFGFSPRKTKR